MADHPTSHAAAKPSLEDFFERLAERNPFERNRVSNLAEAAVDVQSIHQAAFGQLVGLAAHSVKTGRGIGAVLWGEAGVGKSHLLARVQRWAESLHEGKRRAFYVCLHNAHVRPERLPRYILKSTLAALTAGRASRLFDTELYRLVSDALKEAIRQDGANFDRSYTPHDLRELYLQWVQGRGDEAMELAADDWDIHHTLLQFYLAGNRAKRQAGDESLSRTALRWLGGEAVRPEEVDRLGLSSLRGEEETPGLEDDTAIERALVAIMRLARLRGQPFILCFDQVENLSHEGFQSLARFSHSLLDHAPNLLLVTSGVHKELAEFRGDASIPESSWARIAEDRVQLSRISEAQARQLVQARLEPAIEPLLELSAVKQAVTGGELVFPLGRDWLEQKLSEAVEFKPRDVISWCKARLRQQRQRLQELGAEAWLAEWSDGDHRGVEPALDEHELERRIDDAVEARVRQLVERASQDASLAPAELDFWWESSETLLERIDGAAGIEGVWRPKPAKQTMPTYHLMVRTRSGGASSTSFGLTFLCTDNANSAASALRRMCQSESPPGRLLLVSDERQPIPLGKAGQKHLQELRSREQFSELTLSRQDAQTMYALVASLDEAHSGDLEVELPGGARLAIDRDEALASHLRRGRLLNHPLLAALLAARPNIAEHEAAAATLEIDTELEEGEAVLAPGRDEAEGAA